jgi:hypothetical protein
MRSAKKPMRMGGWVQRKKATKLKPAARAAEIPNNCKPTTQKNCQGPRLPGALGKKVPMVIMAKTAAASRGLRRR